MAAAPLVRVEQAGPGPDARVVVSGLSDPERFAAELAPLGTVELIGPRVHGVASADALGAAADRALPGQEAAALRDAVLAAWTAWAGPTPTWQLPTGTLELGAAAVVMGVVNVTPDSFSDGGLLYPRDHPRTGIEHGLRLAAEGAALLDVGGESTRPGSEPVAEAEEHNRVVPVVRALAAQGLACTVDTRKATVARAALDAGAAVVNDVSGAAEPALLDTVAEAGAGYVLMHTRATPKDMQRHTDYDDVVGQVYEFLAAGLDRCQRAGIARDRVAVDPGLGFAKTGDHNLALLRGLRDLRGLGRPVLVGASRKRFLGDLLDQPVASERVEGSLACAAAAVLAGAAVVRAHDVAATVAAVRVAAAIARA